MWGRVCQEEESLQRQASVPGSRPSLGPPPPASPAGTDGPALHPGFGSRFPGRPAQSWGGMSAAFAPGLWTQCGHGPGGGHPRRLPLPHHLLAIWPEKTLLPALCHCCRACSVEISLTSWLDPAVLCLLPLPQRCSRRSHSAAGRQGCVCLLLSSSLGTLKARQRFLGGEEIWGGIWAILNQSKYEIPLTSWVC